MKTSKPNVQRYDDMGCPEQICRVDTMHESDDGDYVLYEDYEALRTACAQLRKDAERLQWVTENWFYQTLDGTWIFSFDESWDAGKHPGLRAAIDSAMRKDAERYRC